MPKEMIKTAFRARGFTLIELMITVAIVGILAAIAYPAYTSQIAKGRRAECRSGLMQAMQQQERYYTQFNDYAAGSLATTKIRQFSGDSLAASACTLAAIADCGSSCIRMSGSLLKADPSGILSLSLDSNGTKDCTLSTGNTDKSMCWP